jgi:hypothetical protein
MSIDDRKSVDSGCAQGIGDVLHHCDQRAGADAHRPREADVLVRARNRYWGKKEQPVLRRDPAGDAACHNRVSNEWEVVAVLLEATYRKHGHARRTVSLITRGRRGDEAVHGA